jgi:hypothetical protein
MTNETRNITRSKRDWRKPVLFFSLAALGGMAMMSSSASAQMGAGDVAADVAPPAVATIPVTPGPSNTPAPPRPTNTPGPSPTTPPTSAVPPPVPTGYPTAAPCYNFDDVGTGDWYYQYVHYLACNNVLNGYPDNTFRPGNPSTRGQVTKMMVGAFRLQINAEGEATFADVPRTDTFYPYVETAARLRIIAGYSCGGPNEPCDAQRRPYFRPNAHITRAQITKIAVLSGQQIRPTRWTLRYPPVATFRDVPSSDPFYPYIETAINTNIIQGYDCGASSEPCPGRYFRPDNNATRSQIAKIVYLAAYLP